MLRLTIPAEGKGPFPGVLLIPGSGAVDMDETLAKDAKPFWRMTQYLSERGFAVLRYNKRGVGSTSNTILFVMYGEILQQINNLIQDSKKALNVLIQQPVRWFLRG